MSWRNLDLESAAAAGRIVSALGKVKKQELEGLCTSAGTVLAENGPYAMFLYLWSRSRDKGDRTSEALRKELYSHVCQAVQWNAGSNSGEAMLQSLAKMSEDFNRLLLMRKVLSQALSYLRYHAKAIAEESAGKRKETVAP